jgi:hypothetical protein
MEISEKLARKRERLAAYLDREKFMLSPDGVQSYGVGSRNVQRYSTDLAEIRAAIKELEEEIAELEGHLAGTKPRKAVVVVPRN